MIFGKIFKVIRLSKVESSKPKEGNLNQDNLEVFRLA
jgi:hypothetical protein